jgi:hypothetical protein
MKRLHYSKACNLKVKFKAQKKPFRPWRFKEKKPKKEKARKITHVNV